MLFPINYNEPLFRPPSEANSLILQLTHGCSWNKCAFCEMYTSKKFKVRTEDEIFNEIDALKPYAAQIRKIFLADGNAMHLSFRRLENILDKLNDSFPKLIRVSAYSLPSDLRNKTKEELKILALKGLKILYVGIESGDNDLLKRTNKSETYESTLKYLNIAKDAGIKLSVMILNGLGGNIYSKQHALNSAKIINLIQPEFLSTLVLSYPYGVEHFKKKFDGDFIELDAIGLIREMGLFIESLNLKNTIYRSDHASNYLVLKGILNRDKQLLLSRINHVLNNQDKSTLRPSNLRSL